MIALLFVHIGIAVTSMGIATVGLVRPSAMLLRYSYSAIAATLVTGTVLTILNPGRLAESCIVGLAYTCVVSLATVHSRQKLAAEFIRKK